MANVSMRQEVAMIASSSSTGENVARRPGRRGAFGAPGAAAASWAGNTLGVDAGAVVLNDRARAVWSAVVREWSLDPASLEVLRAACESITRADEAAAIVSREGQVFRDRWGQARPHPAAIAERDHRAAAARALQALGVVLEGGA